MAIPLRYLETFRRVTRGWLFYGFVAFAVFGIGWTSVSRWRVEKALREYSLCAASADVVCAGRALERARAVDPANLRSRVGQAQMHALLGEAAMAENALLEVLGLAPTRGPANSWSGGLSQPVELSANSLAALPPELRADVLLVAGDVAALRGQTDRALARWTEAAAIADEDSYVRPRRERIAKFEQGRSQERSLAANALREEFEALFATASAGMSDAFPVKSRALRQRVEAVSNQSARQRLLLAIDAANRALRAAAGSGGNGVWSGLGESTADRPKPEPPHRPSFDLVRRNPWLQDQYEREMERYNTALERWEAERSDADQRRMERSNATTASVASLISEARSQLEQGLAALADGGSGEVAQ